MEGDEEMKRIREGVEALEREEEAETDFGQTDFGHPYLTDFGQSDFGHPYLAKKNDRLWQPSFTEFDQNLCGRLWPKLVFQSFGLLFLKKIKQNNKMQKKTQKNTPKGAPKTQKNGAAKGGASKGEAWKGGGPKNSLFFSSPAPVSFFFCLSGCLLVEFWWCFRRLEPSNVHVWALGLSCQAPSALRPPRFHTTARELQTSTFQDPGASNTTKIRRGKKKARNFGPPTLRGPTSRGPNLRAPTFSRFGPPL